QEQVELHPLPPALAQLVLALGPIESIRIVFKVFFDCEVVLGLEVLLDQRQALAEPHEEPAGDPVSETDVTLEELVAEVGFMLAELVHVALEEVELTGVEVLQETAEQPAGEVVADLRPGDVGLLEELGDELDHQAVMLAGYRVGRQAYRQQKQYANQ